MALEAILAALLLVLGLIPLASGPRRRWRAAAAAALALCAAAGAAAWRSLDPPVREDEVTGRPVQVPGDGYVSSSPCRACHPWNDASWRASWHRTMTTVASPETVVGAFDGREVEAWGRRYRLERRGDEFWVGSLAADGAASWRRVRVTTGSHHQQDYWTGSGSTRKLAFVPLMYLREDARWIPFGAAFLEPPSVAPPQPAQLDRWHTTCIKCHATHGVPRTVGDTDAMDTTVAEFGIGCEACHGPGERHVRSQRSPLRRYREHLFGGRDDSIVNPGDLSAERASEVCGQCHGIHRPHAFLPRATRTEDDWRDHGLAFRPGDDLEASRYLVRVSRADEPRMQELRFANAHFLEDRFWSDGAVRVSGREYNGLVESPCFRDGYGDRKLSCLSCHEMHPRAGDPRPLAEWADDQLAPGMDGDRACLQCHERFGEEAALSAHTRHAPASSGSRCQNCHMPYTTWGLLKAIRSHTIDSPDVADTRDTGRPNACLQCHLDRTLRFAARHLEEGWGIEAPPLPPALAAVPASVVWALGGDAGQRALAAWSMGWAPALAASQRGEGWVAEFLAVLLDDPYDAVRYAAYRSLRRQQGFEDFAYDFVGPPAERRAAAARAAALWRSRRARAGEPTDATHLIDARGVSLPANVLDAIYAQRSDRRVWLKE